MTVTQEIAINLEFLNIDGHYVSNGVHYANIEYFNQLPTDVREGKLYSRFSLRLKVLHIT